MKKIAIKSLKSVKPAKAVKKTVEKNIEALEAPHKLKPHYYRYK